MPSSTSEVPRAGARIPHKWWQRWDIFAAQGSGVPRRERGEEVAVDDYEIRAEVRGRPESSRGDGGRRRDACVWRRRTRDGARGRPRRRRDGGHVPVIADSAGAPSA